MLDEIVVFAGIDTEVESPLIGVTSIKGLPFGACEDPIENLHLSVTWPNMSERVITESDVYSSVQSLHVVHVY